MNDLVVGRQGAIGFGRKWPCTIGRSGRTTRKHEGDHATPTGELGIVACYYRPDRMVKPVPWAIALRKDDIWCDDPSHPQYNHISKSPMTHSHEKMWRADPLYDVVLTTNWNWPNADPGKGSAIFMHRWRKRGHPTEGCIAFDLGDLLKLARFLEPGSKIFVKP